MNAITRPSLVGGHHPERGRVLDRREGDGRLGPALAVKGDQPGDVKVGQHVAVDHHEGLVDAGLPGGEADGAGGVQRRRPPPRR